MMEDTIEGLKKQLKHQYVLADITAAMIVHLERRLLKATAEAVTQEYEDYGDFLDFESVDTTAEDYKEYTPTRRGDAKMLKLKAKYRQNINSTWEAHIVNNTHIFVTSAEDLETARVILRIITAEEVIRMRSVRTNWDIVEETIEYYRPVGRSMYL